METRKFITVFTTGRHLFLSWGTSAHALEVFLFKMHVNIFSRLARGFLRGPFPSGSSPEPFTHFFFHPYMPRNLHISSRLSDCYLVRSTDHESRHHEIPCITIVLLRSRYRPQRPILKDRWLRYIVILLWQYIVTKEHETFTNKNYKISVDWQRRFGAGDKCFSQSPAIIC
jgi:hypothetical protein